MHKNIKQFDEFVEMFNERAKFKICNVKFVCIMFYENFAFVRFSHLSTCTISTISVAITVAFSQCAMPSAFSNKTIKIIYVA